MAKKPKISTSYPNQLHSLANDLTKEIEALDDGSDQKEQLELLMSLEEKFRKTIIKTSQAKECYKKFILYIVADQRNRLLAKPYFRERNEAFNEGISEAIKTGNVKKLQTYHINFLLIKFIKDNWRGPMPEKAEKLYHQIDEARNRLIVNNMPLAINQAKIFYRKTPENHLTLTDLIGHCAAGLISGVDKWAAEYSKVWRSACIGYATGFMIDAYSKTQVHLYPGDRASLYRINSMSFKAKTNDVSALSYLLQKEFPEDKEKFSKEKVAILLGTTDVASAEAPVGNQKDPGKDVFLKDFIADENVSIEDSVVQSEAIDQILDAAKNIPVINRKVLKLKGVRV